MVAEEGEEEKAGAKGDPMTIAIAASKLYIVT